ncbi:MAG: SsrA-binding protein SmpB [Pirellulales bacterium]|nr:SsrA-binding protein SmpB [Pirellulales bacterium]
MAKPPHNTSSQAKPAKHAKGAKNAKDGEDKNERVISENRKARHNYHVLDTLECGIVLVGSEVKSLRAGGLSLDEAYARVEHDEVWLFGANIAEYAYSHGLNHEPKRPRKLLLHRREMNKFAGKASEKGFTLVPLKMYFKAGRAKVLLGVCKGKQTHDKRESIKQRDTKREIDRAMRKR